jgi:thioredoxin reductase
VAWLARWPIQAQIFRSKDPWSGAGTALERGCSPFATSLPGIFAVGDVRAGSVIRGASAVGKGSVVISKVWEFVNRKAER